MKKRILSILLTLCMVLSMITPLVSAAETGQSASVLQTAGGQYPANPRAAIPGGGRNLLVSNRGYD